MRFCKKDTAQDVVVSCCILHNFRKSIKQVPQVYNVIEYQLQNEINQNLFDAENNMGSQQFKIQNFLVNNYFNLIDLFH